MAVDIVRGGTCRLIFKPLGGLNVADLGTPQIGVQQDLTFIAPDVTVDVENNRIYADLTESQTMELVDGLETKVQAIYTNDDTEVVYRFPIHYATVSETMFDKVYVNTKYIARNTVPADNPAANAWYEINPAYDPSDPESDEYILTEDTSPQIGKTYYELEES